MFITLKSARYSWWRLPKVNRPLGIGILKGKRWFRQMTTPSSTPTSSLRSCSASGSKSSATARASQPPAPAGPAVPGHQRAAAGVAARRLTAAEPPRETKSELPGPERSGLASSRCRSAEDVPSVAASRQAAPIPAPDGPDSRARAPVRALRRHETSESPRHETGASGAPLQVRAPSVYGRFDGSAEGVAESFGSFSASRSAYSERTASARELLRGREVLVSGVHRVAGVVRVRRSTGSGGPWDE